ncbi:MAG: EAL domain-containing protein [Pseudomonadaceae bacterium]|nr:EAL domain-containing protein [Pseudomonadaceae bacterium]
MSETITSRREHPLRILALQTSESNEALLAALRTSGFDYQLTSHSDLGALLAAFDAEDSDLVIIEWRSWKADQIREFHDLRRLTQGMPMVALLVEDDQALEAVALSCGVQETLPIRHLASESFSRVVTRAMQRCAHTQKPAADIACRPEYNQSLARLTQIDLLTGLANRKHFSELVGTALSKAAGSASMAALVYFDIDRFKLINFAYGQEMGDAALCWFAHRVRDQLRDGDHLARVGGDEFAMLIQGVRNPIEAFQAAQNVHDLLVQPAMLFGIEVKLSVSMGIAVYPKSGADDLIRHADIAMYHAKQSREAYRIRFFDSDLEGRLRSEETMQVELARSLERGEPTVAYQPIYDYAQERVTSAEALFRWPQQSEYDVQQIISHAETNAMIRDIDRYSVNTVLNELTRSPICSLAQVSVNSSVLSLDQTYLSELVGAVAKVGPLPFTLCVELTETAVSADFGNMKRLVQQLRCCNFRVALDDFGTGFASLKYVRELNVDYLKLDMELVRDVARDPSARAICEAAIDMAHTLNIAVVGEGVSSEDQFETLRELKCDYAQGFYIAEPSGLADLAEICAA